TGVNVGTPHFSVAEFGRLVALLAGRSVHPEGAFYASTSRYMLARIEALGWLATLEAAGVRLVVDTCTYVTSILEDTAGVMMTSSAKWAWYAPGNLGVRVVLGSLGECGESAVEGSAVRGDALWGAAWAPTAAGSPTPTIPTTVPASPAGSWVCQPAADPAPAPAPSPSRSAS